MSSPNGGPEPVRYDAFISYSHAADDLLAPRLQAALQQFAKPWWRRRALRVFRDQSSLSANPHLWSSITQALDGTEWFVLLLSPEAAASAWVDQEISYWLEHKDHQRLLPVLTAGTLVWNRSARDLDPSSTVPPSLLGAFIEEPRWVDLRWAKTDTHVDLRNAQFRSVVADIASAIRGVPKDDLESEEVRQHRRTKRTAWAAGIALAVFAVLSALAALFAFDQRNEARAQTLAARSAALVNDRLDLSLLLAAEGYKTNDSLETRAGLLTALNSAAHLTGFHPEVGNLWEIAMSPDGSNLAALSVDGDVTLWDPSDWQQGAVLGNVGAPMTVSISADGTRIAAGSDQGAFMWGVADGEEIGHEFGGPEQGMVAISPDGETLVTRDLFGRVPGLKVWEVTTGQMLDTLNVGGESPLGGVDFSPDGSRIFVSSGGGHVGVFDTVTLEPIIVRDDIETATSLGIVSSPAGDLVATGSDLPPSVSLLDADTLEAVGTPIVPSRGGRIYYLRFSPNGERLLVQTDDGATAVIDVASGLEVETLTGRTGLPAGALWLDSDRLISASDGGLQEWDLNNNTALGRQTPGSRSFDTPSPGVLATAVDDRLSIEWSDGTQQHFTLELPCAFVSISTEAMLGALGCDDGMKPVTLVIDLNDGSTIARHPVFQESPDEYPNGLALSPDGGVIGIAMPRGHVMAIDSKSGDVLLQRTFLDPWAVFTVGWTPDSASLIAAGQLGKLVLFDRSTWLSSAEVLLEPNQLALRDLAMHPDGRRLYVASESGYVWVVDLETLTIDGDPLDASGTQLQGVAVSADGSVVAASSRDGAVRLWETESRRSIGPALRGHGIAGLGLAFGPNGLLSTGLETIDYVTGGGEASTIQWTLEPDQLTQTACALVGRNLTQAEWAEYVPNASYRVTCPEFPPGD